MSANLDQLADRHMRPDPDDALGGAAEVEPGWVHVIVQPGEAELFEGQCAGWMVVNLLARQFKVVAGIQVTTPKVASLEGIVPHEVQGDLESALITWGRLVAGPHIDMRGADDNVRPTFTIVIGCGHVDTLGPVLYLCARGWNWYVGAEPCRVPALESDTNCIGAYLAACQAAGEAFKLFRKLKPGKGRMIDAPFFGSAWTLSEEDTWPSRAVGPRISQLRPIGHVYLPGAGAVGQGAALVMGVSRLPLSVTAIDKDTLDTTNGNRYCLARLRDGGAEKAAFLADYLAGRGIKSRPANMWWSDYFRANGAHAIDEKVQTSERHKLFPLVLSCVDKNNVRWELQNALPQLILGGSTEGLTAQVRSFDLSQNVACLKCNNPLEDRSALREQRRQIALRATEDERSALCEEWGVSRQALGSLMHPQKCGELLPEDLERFGSGSPEMSVGFVSVAAGVLLVAQLVRVAQLGTTQALQDCKDVMMLFRAPGIRTLHLAVDSTCDCQVGALRQQWASIWPASA